MPGFPYVERTLEREFVEGVPVIAYREFSKHPDAIKFAETFNTRVPYVYSEHWSTPGKVHERLFSEKDVLPLMIKLRELKEENDLLRSTGSR